ncbi:hypothetical protein BJX61DRAFT_541024 [Aspergillus egyptiacus]|nr:hypothetical protein BJX61DRAFT_541024 [Aspergillus egyptiacus]
MPYRLVKSNSSRTMLMREYYPSDSESESDFDSGYDTGYDSPWDDDWDDDNNPDPKDKNNNHNDDDDDSDSESSHGNDIIRINHISLSNLQTDDTNSIDVNLDDTDTDTDSEANSLADLDHDHDLDTVSLNGYIDDDVYRYDPYNDNGNNNNGREEGSFHTTLDVLIGESVRSEVEAALVADGPGYMGSASTTRNTRTAGQAGLDDDDDGYGRRVRRRIS